MLWAYNTRACPRRRSTRPPAPSQRTNTLSPAQSPEPLAGCIALSTWLEPSLKDVSPPLPDKSAAAAAGVACLWLHAAGRACALAPRISTRAALACLPTHPFAHPSTRSPTPPLHPAPSGAPRQPAPPFLRGARQRRQPYPSSHRHNNPGGTRARVCMWCACVCGGGACVVCLWRGG